MKEWKQLYHNRTLTCNQAINKVRHNDDVFISAYSNEPQALINELIVQKERLKGINLYVNPSGGYLKYSDKENLDYFNIKTFLSSDKLKEAIENYNCEYLPLNVYDITRFIKENEVDFAFIQASPPNKDGYCNLGLAVEAAHTLIQEAKVVIAEINPKLPATYGDTLVNVDKIDFFVEGNNPLIEIKAQRKNEVTKKIGENVASIIPDKATIQWGIGNIPESVLYYLEGKKDLGVHSGAITDSIIKLIESKVITNKYKRFKTNKTICSALFGTESLYTYAEKNPDIELHSFNITHNPKIISEIDNFFSINSAIEVDLTGQINTESIGNITVAGVGGQMDFIKGAKLSKGGKSIIALSATAQNETISKIKTTINRTTSLKTEVDYIVTEFGIASIFGKTLRERAKELISIAHPKFREALLQDIFKIF